ILSEAAHARTTWSGTPGTNEGDHELLQKLGGDPPQRMIAIPLIARERSVAVLYADSAGLEPDAVNLEALETLVRVAGMAVELLAANRPAATRPAAQPAEHPAPVEAVPARAGEAASTAVAEASPESVEAAPHGVEATPTGAEASPPVVE